MDVVFLGFLLKPTKRGVPSCHVNVREVLGMDLWKRVMFAPTIGVNHGIRKSEIREAPENLHGSSIDSLWDR